MFHSTAASSAAGASASPSASPPAFRSDFPLIKTLKGEASEDLAIILLLLGRLTKILRCMVGQRMR